MSTHIDRGDWDSGGAGHRFASKSEQACVLSLFYPCLVANTNSDWSMAQISPALGPTVCLAFTCSKPRTSMLTNLPQLMLAFVILTNILLLTSLIAILSNSLTKVRALVFFATVRNQSRILSKGSAWGYPLCIQDGLSTKTSS